MRTSWVRTGVEWKKGTAQRWDDLFPKWEIGGQNVEMGNKLRHRKEEMGEKDVNWKGGGTACSLSTEIKDKLVRWGTSYDMEMGEKQRRCGSSVVEV